MLKLEAHWMFDVGRWVLDVFHRFMGSMRELFGEFSPHLTPLPLSNAEREKRAQRLGNPDAWAHGFNARMFWRILSPPGEEGTPCDAMLTTGFRIDDRLRANHL